MKSSIKTLTLAFLAILSFSSCSSDEDNQEKSIDPYTYSKLELVGRWNVKVSDKSVIEDSSVWFTFNQDGTFRRELYDALSPSGQQNFVAEGTWETSYADYKVVLRITTNETNAEPGADTTHTDEYLIVKYAGNSFKALNGETEYDFTKIIYDLKSATIIQYTIKGRFMNR